MSVVGELQKVFRSRELSKKAKGEVYNAMVVPMITYGCESWVLRERERTGCRLPSMLSSALIKLYS